MRKRVLFVAALLVMAAMLVCIPAFAEDNFDSVEVSANLQLAKAGEPITSETGSTLLVRTSETKNPSFDFLCNLNMKPVRDKFTYYFDSWEEIISFAEEDREYRQSWLDQMQITGSFDIKITYPEDLAVPSDFLQSGKMNGFCEEAKRIFGNDTRTLSKENGRTLLTITLNVVGPDDGNGGRLGYVVAKDLRENLNKYLCDFSLTCKGASTTKEGVYRVTGTMDGYTFAKGRSATLTVDYTTATEASAMFLYTSEAPAADYTITFDVGGDPESVTRKTVKAGTVISVSELPIPYKEGSKFDGWYFDAERTNEVIVDFKIDRDVVLYAVFSPATVADALSSEEHVAYVIGYPDGTVRPTNNITREEVATIFFRLLTDERRNSILTKTNNFPDVADERWSNIAISTMQKGGYIEGYPDGSFKPAKNITRAEFAAIVSRLDKAEEKVSHSFTDISGHWAESYIANAVAKGWLAGYTDGTFRPDKFITRAEAMTIINRMLARYADEETLISGCIIWPDNPKSAWYYYAVEEATNSHEYVYRPYVVYEDWTKILPVPDWAAFDRGYAK